MTPTHIDRRKLLKLTSLMAAQPFLAPWSWAAGTPASHFAAGNFNEDPKSPKFDETSKGFPFSFRDAAGRSVVVQSLPKTFVVANYIANFIVVGGGQSLSKIVGLTQEGWPQTRAGEYEVYTKAFPQIKSIPSIGGYHDNILNAEKILALKPDVLIMGRAQYADNATRIDTFEKAGITVVVVDYHAMTLANHIWSTRILGRLLGRDDEAIEQCQDYLNTLLDTFTRIEQLPTNERQRSVYVELGNRGTADFGNSYNNTILWGAILKNIDCANINAQNKEAYGPLSREYIVSKNPSYVVIAGSIWLTDAANDQMHMGFTVTREDAQKCLEGFLNRPIWKNIEAVSQRNFAGVDHGSLRQMVDCHFTVFLAKFFYPKAFQDKNPEADILAFYKKWVPELDPTGTFTIQLNNA